MEDEERRWEPIGLDVGGREKGEEVERDLKEREAKVSREPTTSEKARKRTDLRSSEIDGFHEEARGELSNDSELSESEASPCEPDADVHRELMEEGSKSNVEDAQI